MENSYNSGKPNSRNLYRQSAGNKLSITRTVKLKKNNISRWASDKKLEKFNEDGAPFLVISYKDDVEVSINGVRIKLPESDTKLINSYFAYGENINIRKEIIATTDKEFEKQLRPLSFSDLKDKNR